MIFYHGTRDQNLKLLTTKHVSGTATGRIYLTNSYAWAFLYAACSLRCFYADQATDTLWIVEKAPNALEKMYKGKSCLIYSFELEGATKQQHRSNHVYTYDKNINLQTAKCEKISDSLEKLFELEKQGLLKVKRWNEFTKEEQKEAYQNMITCFKPTIKLEKEKYPEEYQLLVSMFPELEVND